MDGVRGRWWGESIGKRCASQATKAETFTAKGDQIHIFADLEDQSKKSN
jgi:hypothetical protein